MTDLFDFLESVGPELPTGSDVGHISGTTQERIVNDSQTTRTIAKGRVPQQMAMTIRDDRVPPTMMDHQCDHPGCRKWGSFGMMPNDDLAKSYWWCRKHLPDWWLG